MNSVPKDVKFEKLVIAYEPIWSIGTGVLPTSEQIKEMAKLIKIQEKKMHSDFKRNVKMKHLFKKIVDFKIELIDSNCS